MHGAPLHFCVSNHIKPIQLLQSGSNPTVFGKRVGPTWMASKCQKCFFPCSHDKNNLINSFGFMVNCLSSLWTMYHVLLRYHKTIMDKCLLRCKCQTVSFDLELMRIEKDTQFMENPTIYKQFQTQGMNHQAVLDISRIIQSKLIPDSICRGTTPPK